MCWQSFHVESQHRADIPDYQMLHILAKEEHVVTFCVHSFYSACLQLSSPPLLVFPCTGLSARMSAVAAVYCGEDQDATAVRSPLPRQTIRFFKLISVALSCVLLA